VYMVVAIVLFSVMSVPAIPPADTAYQKTRL